MDGVPHEQSRVSLDTRGAILVVGLALGLVLALAVHTLVDVGSAVLDRETLQSAADAAAFESAVWHARGMNTLAGLNVLLALVLATLVFWRLATFTVGLAVLLEATAMVQQPGAAPTQIPELTPLAELLEKDAHVAGSVLVAASGLRVAQAAVAAYTPVLAAHAAALHTRESHEVAARTFSASLLPSVGTDGAESLAACLRGPGASSGGESSGSAGPGGGLENAGLASFRDHAEEEVKSILAFAESGPRVEGTTRLGMPFSLPVEVGGGASLCERAASLSHHAEPGPAYASSVIQILSGNEPVSARKLRALTGLGLASKDARLRSLGEAWSGVLEAKAPAIFCAPAGQGVDALRGSIVNLASGLRELATDDRTRATLARLSRGGESAHGGPQSLEDARSIWHAWQRALDAGEDPGRCIRPAQVWLPARNGNGFFRSASSADMPSTSSSAAPSAEVNERSAYQATAHAEAFFDCEDSWDRCRSNALWEPSWSARLRRVRSFRASLESSERSPTFSAVDASVAEMWLDRLARRIGETRVASDVLGERRHLEPEPEPVARTSSFGLLPALAGGSRHVDRPLAGFVARHANDSSIVH